LTVSEQKRTRKEDFGEPPATGKFASGKETGARKARSDKNLRPAKITQLHDPKPTNELLRKTEEKDADPCREGNRNW